MNNKFHEEVSNSRTGKFYFNCESSAEIMFCGEFSRLLITSLCAFRSTLARSMNTRECGNSFSVSIENNAVGFRQFIFLHRLFKCQGKKLIAKNYFEKISNCFFTLAISLPQNCTIISIFHSQLHQISVSNNNDIVLRLSRVFAKLFSLSLISFPTTIKWSISQDKIAHLKLLKWRHHKIQFWNHFILFVNRNLNSNPNHPSIVPPFFCEKVKSSKKCCDLKQCEEKSL